MIWIDRNSKQIMHVGNLHKWLADDPAPRLALLRGLCEWEHRWVCSEACGPPRSYKPMEWAAMIEAGYMGAQDEEVCGGMVGRGLEAMG